MFTIMLTVGARDAFFHDTQARNLVLITGRSENIPVSPFNVQPLAARPQANLSEHCKSKNPPMSVKDAMDASVTVSLCQ